jgi:hypothetical protein
LAPFPEMTTSAALVVDVKTWLPVPVALMPAISCVPVI